MPARDELIQQLAGELAPTRPVAKALPAALAWLAAGAALVVAATLATGPLRPGLLAQLASQPGFVVDLLLGAAAAGTAAFASMRLRIPGLAYGRRAALLPLLLFAAWAAWQGVEWLQLTGPASMLGKREACGLQVVLFSLPPLALALWLARRAAAFERGWTGLVAGVGAGALPALAMQVACMDAPLHALGLHVAPVLVAGALGGALARWMLPRI